MSQTRTQGLQEVKRLVNENETKKAMHCICIIQGNRNTMSEKVSLVSALRTLK